MAAGGAEDADGLLDGGTVGVVGTGNVDAAAGWGMAGWLGAGAGRSLR
jgi:hypothetical protein